MLAALTLSVVVATGCSDSGVDTDDVAAQETSTTSSSTQAAPRTVSVDGVMLTITATVTKSTWQMGNGDRVECNGPGTPYDPSKPETAQDTSCSYLYKRSSAGASHDNSFKVTATTEWRGHASAPAEGIERDLGTVTRSSSMFVRVAEVQAVNTR